MRAAVFVLPVSLALALGSGACSGEPSGTAQTLKPAAADAGPGGEPPTADAGQVPDALESCIPVQPPECSSAPPYVGPEREWRHNATQFTPGTANHRGRDLFINPGMPQWIIGKFTFGAALAEVTVKDEEVDVWLNRECGPGWEKIGTVITTDTPSKPTIEGIADEPGRIFYEIPENKRLPIGRHRVRLVLAGNLSWAELFIEVVAPGTPLFVSDVDGTLTTSENAEFTSVLSGALSPANDGAAEALTLLALRGYRPMYLTARPEWLVERTRDFVRDRGFPAGIIHTTTLGGIGIQGDAAVAFKSGELQMLADKGLTPSFVIGNTATDAQAYDNGKIQPLDHRLFFQFGELDGGLIFGGRRFESYKTLATEFKSLPPVCP